MKKKVRIKVSPAERWEDFFYGAFTSRDAEMNEPQGPTLGTRCKVLGSEVASAIHDAVRDRDMEWWQACALVDNVAPTPEAVKQWIAVSTEHAVQAAVLAEARLWDLQTKKFTDAETEEWVVEHLAELERARGGADGRTI